ncbi:ABC transporter ATP-binding protein [Streptomyces sp. NPDC088925]|uniref:ABC transporter ATP-binding protein n=1 Tax=Streptomyces sp. NPDC088925 TaxID=3365914 RepID=UPI003824E09A
MAAPSPSPADDVLRAEGLYVTRHGSPVLSDVTLSLRHGEILAVGGPRGSGRSTLLRCLAGMVRPDQGGIWFDGAPLHELSTARRARVRRDHFGWLEETPHLAPEFTAWENAALPLLLRGVPHRAARDVATEWLERLDIAPCARRRPHALTHLEQHRVAIARALASTPALLFADEPTAALHSADRAVLLRTLVTAARTHGISMLLTTHGDEAAELADRSVSLRDGRLADATSVSGDVPGTEEGKATCSVSV